mgnify:FL=1
MHFVSFCSFLVCIFLFHLQLGDVAADQGAARLLARFDTTETAKPLAATVKFTVEGASLLGIAPAFADARGPLTIADVSYIATASKYTAE